MLYLSFKKSSVIEAQGALERMSSGGVRREGSAETSLSSGISVNFKNQCHGQSFV